MHDPWIDRLSEYLDGELDAADRAALEQHIAACDVCTATLVELRAVIAAAAAAPRDVPPVTDLWTGIAARIGAAETTLRPIGAPRRYTFSAAQLAAAAVLLVAISGTAVWQIARTEHGTAAFAGTIVHAAGAPPQSGRLVDAAPAATAPDPELDRAIADVERVLQEQRDRLDPATVEVLERSMASIDDAIREARAALAADPGNEWLHRQLDSTMRKKLDVLRRAERTTRAGA
jgi:hypothetical protein